MTQAATATSPSKLSINAPVPAGCEFIFSDEAMAFAQSVIEKFQPRRDALLAERVKKQAELDKTGVMDFRADTTAIREGDWKVAPIPKDLQDRRVEITGPAEPKMIINALNSGARVFMADIEDSLSPTFAKVAEAQKALYEAVRHELKFASPEGKEYALNAADTLAVMIVRPRGWHLPERHITYNGAPTCGALIDFALYFFHNAKERVARGTGPYFYIPKLESAEEAQLWADVFAFGEETLGLPKGTVKATVLIEVLNAVFEMHEILHALKDYAVGLNCGRWDYIFSTIKKMKAHAQYALPDRAQVTMNKAFLKSYSELLIQTCHKRGAFAMGGMAAAIPVKNDEAANAKAFAAVKADKQREVQYGHDGTWVAHPGLIPVAMEAFNEGMPQPNQLDNLREDVRIVATDLLAMHEGTITEAGVRNNMNVTIQYMANWLNGNGCVPIFNMMEDAATAEISRSQLWQWNHHARTLDDGRTVTEEMLRSIADEEMAKIKESVGDAGWEALPYAKAKELVLELVTSKDFEEFLTLPAYERLLID